MKLSHSKSERYNRCPRSYDLHYNKRIRPITLSSPLFFGSACDEAINVLLLKKKKNHTPEEAELFKLKPQDIFLDHMRTTKVHRSGPDVQLNTYPHIQYSKTDFDSSLLTDDDFQEIGQDKAFCEAHFEWYNSELKKKKSTTTDEDTKMYNQIMWHCLYRKGLMIIEEYEKTILPEIHEVFSIQTEVSLPNEDGDEIIGFIDFIASFVDDPSRKYIVDNKSSASAYKQSNLDESAQLHTYAEDQGIDDICYIVYEKNIRKTTRTGPRCRITIWKGTINEEQMEKTFDNYIKTLDNIKEGKFNPDFNSGCFFFGRKCEFHDICHKEQMGPLLVNLNKEKK